MEDILYVVVVVFTVCVPLVWCSTQTFVPQLLIYSTNIKMAFFHLYDSLLLLPTWARGMHAQLIKSQIHIFVVHFTRIRSGIFFYHGAEMVPPNKIGNSECLRILFKVLAKF